MRSLPPIVALLSFSALTPALADPIPGTEFTAGYWSGAAYTDDRGAFLYCDVSVAYTNGEVLWLGLYSDDTLAVLMSAPYASYRPGETFDSWLMLETGLPTHGVSEAWDASYAGITLEGIGPSIDFLTTGQWLRLLGIGIDEAFDVTGIAEALEMARVCHARNSGSNPFAVAEPTPEPLPEPEPEPMPEPEPEPKPGLISAPEPEPEPQPQPVLGTSPPMPKVPDLTPKPGGGLGTRPGGGALGTPAPKPQP
jgi:hypothetical protein